MKKMNIKISISKKIIGMVVMIVLAICLVVGIGSANIIKGNITDEIEIQLKTGAYAISQTLKFCTSDEEMNNAIVELYNYTGMDITVFNSEIDDKPKRIATTVEGAINTRMDGHIYEELLTGENYFATDANVNGEPYFGYYIPFFIDGEFNGATFTGIPQSEAIQTIMFSIMKIIGLIVICGVVAIIVATLLVRGIVKGINKLREMIQSLADNDLSVEFNEYEIENDEIGSAYNDLSNVISHLRKIMMNNSKLAKELKSISGDLNTNVQFTNDTCTQISQAVENVASGAVSQAEDTTNAAQNISEMSDELGKIKTNANDLHSIANSMDNAKNNALNTLDELQKVNGFMAEEVNSTSNQVNATSESVEQIKKAVEMIQDIAAQTKLLSLNASIEAVHAGEHGKGFAVVAEEIGKLASQSAQSSDEIEEILKQLVKNYEIIIQNVKSTSDNMEVQNGKLVETQNVFAVLEKDINGTVERIAEINTMVHHLDVEIGKMVDMVSNLSAISEENSASTEETMAAIEELTATVSQVAEKAQNVDRSADVLIQEVNVFKTV